MRGPALLHRSARLGRRPSRSPKHSLSFRHIMDSSTEIDMIASLTWTISPVDNGEVFCFCARTLYSPSKLDIKSSLRLIAMRLSGNMEVYTISQSLGSFKFEGPITPTRRCRTLSQMGLSLSTPKPAHLARQTDNALWTCYISTGKKAGLWFLSRPGWKESGVSWISLVNALQRSNGTPNRGL